MELYFANVVLLHVLLRLFFPWLYNGRNLDLFSSGFDNEGAKLLFSFFPWHNYFFVEKTEIGQLNQMVLFLSFCPSGMSTPQTAQTDP